jgi:hypothetical protein
MINWSYVRRGRAAAWTELLCSAADSSRPTLRHLSQVRHVSRFSFLARCLVNRVSGTRRGVRSLLERDSIAGRAIIFWGNGGEWYSSNE